MYDIFASDEYFFSYEVSFLIETKDKVKLLSLIEEKHTWEIQDNISTLTKKNDLLVWNVLFTREIIKNGISKQYLHPLYNKYYKSIQVPHSLTELQQIEIKMIHSYFDILINFLEATDHLMVNKMIAYLYLHIESQISLTEMAKSLNISVGYLCDCFKKNIGMSIMNYAKKIKVERAQTLLLSTDKSILEISTLLGFCDQSHFSKTFKSISGRSPSKYRT